MGNSNFTEQAKTRTAHPTIHVHPIIHSSSIFLISIKANSILPGHRPEILKPSQIPYSLTCNWSHREFLPLYLLNISRGWPLLTTSIFTTLIQIILSPAWIIRIISLLASTRVYSQHSSTPVFLPGECCHSLLQGIFPTQGSNLHLLHLLHGRWMFYHWDTREAHLTGYDYIKTWFENINSLKL